MLVYANSFSLNPNDGPMAVIQLIAAWVGKPRKYYVDPARLAAGIRELNLADGATLSSRVTVDEEEKPQYPFYFCARLTHGQPDVPGRRWTTEIGIRQGSEADVLQCSVLLKTDEISARVTAPIQATRPQIVRQLLEQCDPVGETPGLSVKRLNEANASAFAYEIEHENRSYPLIQISCDRDGRYPVTSERMRSLVMGLAQVIEIPVDADTFKIQSILGRRYSSYGGAINIIFPSRKTADGSFCRTTLFRPDQIEAFDDAGGSIESEILATITHQTNLPNSWLHISTEMVGQAILSARLRSAIAAAQHTGESAALEELLEEAADQIESKDQELTELRSELVESEANLDQIRAENAGLKHALSGATSRSDVETVQVTEALAPLREMVVSQLRGGASLEQSLRLISRLFANRVVVLETALDSAKGSDRGGFRYANKAFDLLLNLADTYWAALVDGQGDQDAKNVFGQSFSAKESKNLSAEGRSRRTFIYLDREIIMEKHLKIGVKDSIAETLRIHFEWISEEEKIVVGYCGKHIDF